MQRQNTKRPDVVVNDAERGTSQSLVFAMQQRIEAKSPDEELHMLRILQAIEILTDRVGVLETVATEIRQTLTMTQLTKESYTTKEVATLLQRKPFTVREWCRLGRVNAFKIESGRGADDEWRITHEELGRIRNEGLLELTNHRATA